MGTEPDKQAPSTFDFPASIESDRGALLRFICPQMTDADLVKIAWNDTPDCELHLEALRVARTTMKVAGRLEWNPKEAIELERWEKPSSADGHRRRLFACAILADAYCEEDSREYLHSLSDILAPLVESAIFLGNNATLQARRSVSATLKLPFPWWEESLLFAGLAAIVLSVAAARAEDDEFISRLCDWVGAERLRIDKEELGADQGPGLLGVTHFNQHHSLWQAMAQRYLTPRPLIRARLWVSCVPSEPNLSSGYVPRSSNLEPAK
ncbi:MAG: hypothetical protein KF691_00445 [Phycisphaeraceae bacterium]|nr:hypothetical protein [Phycisphaeraceae bacterium]